MKVLVTGSAGFIGFPVAQHLLERGDEVVGFDMVNDHFDPVPKGALDLKASIDLLPLQPGDGPDMLEHVSALQAAVGHKPETPVRENVRAFVDGYLSYFERGVRP